MERRLTLLQEAERLGIPFRHLTALLTDYALSRRTQRDFLERWFHNLADWLREHSFFEVLEYVGRLAILLAILSFFIGLPKSHARHQAIRWEMVERAAGDEYDSNRPESLETLNRDCFPMKGLEAPAAKLRGLRLDGCYRTLGGLTWGGGLLGRHLPVLYRYRGASLQGAHLARADLTGARLRGAVLSSADLRGTHLAGADLTQADLRGANLAKADLLGASLVGADMTGADLRGADLSRTDLTGAVLANARLCGARLVRARLHRTELDHARGCEPEVMDEGPNFSGADLRGAQLFRAQLPRARWTRSRVDPKTAFDQADVGDPPRAEASPTPQIVRLGLVVGDDVFFFDEVERGAREAVARLDPQARVEVLRVRSGDAASRVAARLAELGTRVDALVLSMLEDVDLDQLRDFVGDGITVACYDQCEPVQSHSRGFIASFESNHETLGYESGRVLANWLRKHRRELPGNLRILAFRDCLSDGCFRRVQGFRRALAAEADYRVAGQGNGFAEACRLLQDNPGPVVVWAANQTGVEVAVEAVHALGREDESWVFGIDLSPVLAGMLLDPRNVLQAVVAQDPYGMGFQATSRAISAAQGELFPYEWDHTGQRLWQRQRLSRTEQRELYRLAEAAHPAPTPRTCP